MLRFYLGATAGLSDGTPVSFDHSFSSPIHFDLDVTAGDDEQIIPVGVRTDLGYKTYGATTIYDSGDINDRYQLCKTAGGSYADSITFNEPITNANVIFYAKARTTSDEFSTLDRYARFVADYALESD
ncbi:MAG: hypothetical protein J5497_04450 [Selenomonadaceae bacterium]|nr:hypothetical protein [Selenomonadaceae bacterium]